MPTKLYTVRGRKEVDINSEEAANVKELLQFYATVFGAKPQEQAAPAEEAPTQAETPTEEAEAPVTVATEFAEPVRQTTEEPAAEGQKYQYADLPQELKDIIDNMFERENAKRRANDENLIRSVVQYTTFPTPQRAIREYFAANPQQDETAIAPATPEEAFAQAPTTNKYSDRVESATSVADLKRIESEVSLDGDLDDATANVIMTRIAERKAELGSDAGEAIPAVTEEEKILAEESIPTSEDMMNKQNRIIDDAASKPKEDLDEDFFDNINEC
jgi:hypothetical protein